MRAVISSWATRKVCCISYLENPVAEIVKPWHLNGMKGKWSCRDCREKSKLNLILKFESNRTYCFWDTTVKSFFVFYCFCQNFDKVNEENCQNMVMNIFFLPIIYQYFMNKASYYFYLTEFWSKTCQFVWPKTLTEN